MRRRPATLASVVLAVVLVLVSVGSATQGANAERDVLRASSSTDLISNTNVVTMPEASRATDGREDSRSSSRLGLILAVLVAAIVVFASRRWAAIDISGHGPVLGRRGRSDRPRAPPLAI